MKERGVLSPMAVVQEKLNFNCVHTADSGGVFLEAAASGAAVRDSGAGPRNFLIMAHDSWVSLVGG